MFSGLYAFLVIRKIYNKEKLDKSKCELCGEDNKDVLNVHHIIPRCDARSSNNLSNLCVCCVRCHSLIHTGQYIIIGCFSTTGGRKVMWFKEGEEPPLEKKHWLIKENPLVIRGKK